jgi:ribosomal protein S18 acetylase RimI-like enzyme
MLMSSLSLRAVTPTDRDHLFRVYASTRDEELAVVPWSPEQKTAFLEMQFTARERDYAARFSTKDHSVVERGGSPIGYVWVHRSENELRVLDVALLPEHRNAGIGTQLMTTLIEEARERRVPLRLYVLANGAARRLYERLGFTPVSEASVYQLMELLP